MLLSKQYLLSVILAWYAGGNCRCSVAKESKMESAENELLAFKDCNSGFKGFDCLLLTLNNVQ